MSYITIEDVRDQGVTVATASDEYVQLLIDSWQGWIDRYCRQWFEPREMTWDRDGNGTTLMQLPVPIIELDTLYVNGNFTTALNPDSYLVYDGLGGDGKPDDRKNPRIKIRTTANSIFDGTGDLDSGCLVFEAGEKNQRLVGTFGYVESDGESTPAAIKLALLKLVVAEAKKGQLGSVGPTAAGPVIEEETDRHRLKYADLSSSVVSVSGNAEIDRLLAAYRGPLNLGAPRSMGRRLVGGSGTIF